MRICYYGTYDRDYCRNEILRRGLGLAGAEVFECHEPVWQTQDKSQLRGVGEKLATGLRFVRSRRRLHLRYRDVPDHDVVLLGYLGHLDVGSAKRVAGARPVIIDAFLSLYETVVEDRRMVGPGNPAAALLKRLERRAYDRADLILLDTDAHIDYVADEFGIAREKFARVFVGADDRLFRPPEAPVERGDTWDVLFYGKFIPLHGIEHIIRAAHILSGRAQVRLTLIGTGQTYSGARRLADELRLTNIHWVDWVDYSQLPQRIASADVCLGVFASGGKAARVIPNKVFQCLACGAKVISADTPAMRELPPMGGNLHLVPAADAEAIAEAILGACEDRCPPRRPAGLDQLLPIELGRGLLGRLEQIAR